MSRNRSIPSRKVVVYVPEEAWREFRGKFSDTRDWDGDRLGNESPEQSQLAVGATHQMASVLLDVDLGDDNFVINPDGSLERDGKARDDSGRWIGGDD